MKSRQRKARPQRSSCTRPIPAGLSLVGGREQQREAKLRDRCRRTRTWTPSACVPGSHSRRRASSSPTRAELRRAEEGGAEQGFQTGLVRRESQLHAQNKNHHFKSHNVIGKLEGGDAKKKNEYVIYTAHWDHLGRDPKLQGDQIYNGALDNASGVASLLEIAQAFTKLPQPPPRSILFMATTAEEAGLLGAKYYAEHPLYPLDHTLADINIDIVNPWGKTRDVEDIGYGSSTLDEMFAAAAQATWPDGKAQHANRKREPSTEPTNLSLPRSECPASTSGASRKTTSESRPTTASRRATITPCIIIIRSPTR